MTATHESTGRPERIERAARQRLRAGIVRLGGDLGWDAPMVVRFSEAAAGRPWRQCGRPELLRVLGAFAGLAARMRAQCQESADARTIGVARAGDGVDSRRRGER